MAAISWSLSRRSGMASIGPTEPENAGEMNAAGDLTDSATYSLAYMPGRRSFAQSLTWASEGNPEITAVDVGPS